MLITKRTLGKGTHMGFLDRFRRTPREPSHVPGAGDRATYLRYLDESVTSLVETAFHDLDEAELVLRDQFLEDPESPLTRDEVMSALHRAWAARLDRQSTWDDEGDYRRIAAAFERLEATGVVARMNFTCCQSCGHAEIGDEQGPDSRGYTFWHQQDTERIPDGDLYLAFGGFHYAEALDPDLVARAEAGDDEAKAQAIRRTEELVGADVVDALRSEGLSVEWDGTNQTRIRVTGIDWRKKLPVG